MATIVTLPPHNQDAEESLLGSLVINGDLIGLISKIVRPDDFYFEVNQWTFEASIALYHRREAINQITLCQELLRQSKLESCGGAARMSYLISVCPTSTDAEYYAEIIKRLSICRQAITAGDKISAIGYAEGADNSETLSKITDVVDNLKKKNSTSKHLVTPYDAADITLHLIDTYNQPSNALSTGFYDLDDVTTGLYKCEMTVVGARPSIGKTQILLDIAENIAAKKQKVLFCSVEMSINQIMERKASRNLKMSIRNLRKRGLDNDQMQELAELAVRISETPIHYLSEGTEVADIEREINILQEKEGVDIVFVDYLQRLKDCWVGGENMNIRTGRASWALKSIANEHNIPIVVASQLNRASEIRENKRPTMADLRDCLAKGTVCLSSNGSLIPIENLKAGDELITLGQSFGLSRGKVKTAWFSGRKPVYILTTQTGRTVRATGKHRFLMHESGSIRRGWWSVVDARVGWKIAVPRKYPLVGEQSMRESDALLLGWLMGDGYLGKYSVQLTVGNRADAEIAKNLIDSAWNLDCHVKQYTGKQALRVNPSTGKMSGAGKNPLTLWLRSIGVLGKTGKNKSIPLVIFQEDTKNVAAFLRGLFHADGSVSLTNSNGLCIKYVTISDDLARGVQHLLLRFGIVSTLSKQSHGNSGYHTKEACINSISITHIDHVRAFASLIGFLGEKHVHLQNLLNSYQSKGKKKLRSGDLAWERIVSITEEGVEDTYDVEMVGSPYFCANDILSHNSGNIEQDADNILLLYRDDVNPQYLEVKQAKNRQLGESRVVTLLWSEELRRYVNATK